MWLFILTILCALVPLCENHQFVPLRAIISTKSPNCEKLLINVDKFYLQQYNGSKQFLYSHPK